MHRRALLAATLMGALPRLSAAAQRPVVLELFTSQGCSSCPPADALLGKLAKQPDVIALAWHVDYWNNLGWLDKFAFRQATLRQQAYASQIGTEVFTPALVVDGANVVVGSDQAAVARAIATAPALQVPVTLTRAKDSMVVDVGRGAGPLRAISVIYDPEHSTNVGAGENDGARLNEYRIVRQFEVLGEWDGTPHRFTTKLAAPAQGQVILVHAADLRVVGAAEQPSVTYANQAS
jgi:hypothetical protein